MQTTELSEYDFHDEVIDLKTIISLLIQTEEDKVIIHFEADKDKFKNMIEPLLASALMHSNIEESVKNATKKTDPSS